MPSNALKNIIENEKRTAWATGKERERWEQNQQYERAYNLACARHEAIHKLCESIRTSNADLIKEIEAIQKDIERTLWAEGTPTPNYISWAYHRGRAIHSYIMPEMDTLTKAMLDAIKNT